jgi:hypothetical protein
MNERIQQLLIEAHKQTDGGIYNGHLSVWTEKFAELIVRECSKIVTIWSDEEPCSEGYDITPVAKMKEHFGVEE